MPSRRPSTRTISPTTANMTPQTMSALRTRFLSSIGQRGQGTPVAPQATARRRRASDGAVRTWLLQQAPLAHEVLVHGLRALQPLHELGPGLPGGVQGALRKVVLELRRLVYLLQHSLVEGDGLGRHS